MTESELQPVLKALRGANINVVAIHSHMVHEEPRIMFLHFWGKGTAEDLAQDVKGAKVTGRPGGGQGTVGERIFQFEPGMLTFTEEAAPVTPEKPK